LGSSFDSFDVVDCRTQVVAGTMFYFKIAAAPVETDGQVLWIKVFSQPWTNTREVTGVLYEDEFKPLGFFGNNCSLPCGDVLELADDEGVLPVVTIEVDDTPAAPAVIVENNGDALAEELACTKERLREVDSEVFKLQQEQATLQKKIESLNVRLDDCESFSITVRRSEQHNYTVMVTSSDKMDDVKKKLVQILEARHRQKTGSFEKLGLSSGQIDIFNDGKIVFGKTLKALGIVAGDTLTYAIRNAPK
jgi:hypothetical protein